MAATAHARDKQAAVEAAMEAAAEAASKRERAVEAERREETARTVREALAAASAEMEAVKEQLRTEKEKAINDAVARVRSEMEAKLEVLLERSEAKKGDAAATDQATGIRSSPSDDEGSEIRGESSGNFPSDSVVDEGSDQSFAKRALLCSGRSSQMEESMLGEAFGGKACEDVLSPMRLGHVVGGENGSDSFGDAMSAGVGDG
eukprot:1753411-Pleurochrysis_carterae.AAC.1